MLWTVFVILLILWALGMVSSYTLGGFIHILLVVALVVVLLRVIQGRRPICRRVSRWPGRPRGRARRRS
jgi:multisubunit Na+/H+ antiporter MnhE subunit